MLIPTLPQYQKCQYCTATNAEIRITRQIHCPPSFLPFQIPQPISPTPTGPKRFHPANKALRMTLPHQTIIPPLADTKLVANLLYFSHTTDIDPRTVQSTAPATIPIPTPHSIISFQLSSLFHFQYKIKGSQNIQFPIVTSCPSPAKTPDKTSHFPCRNLKYFTIAQTIQT